MPPWAASSVAPDQLQLVGVRFARGEGDGWRAGVAISGLYPVDVREAGGRLKSGGKAELPAVSNGIPDESFYVIRRWGVGFNFEAPAIEGAAAVSVGRDVQVEDENRFPQFAVGSLSDVGAEAGVAAVRSLRGTAQHVFSKDIRVSFAVGAEDLLSGQGCRTQASKRGKYQKSGVSCHKRPLARYY